MNFRLSGRALLQAGESCTIRREKHRRNPDGGRGQVFSAAGCWGGDLCCDVSVLHAE